MQRKTHKQRILAILFPFLATDRIARQKWGRSWRLAGRPEGPPFVVIGTIKNAQRIIAHEEGMERHGIARQQNLSDARAIIPELECIRHDSAADHALLSTLASWCERYTPLVALSDGNGLFLDITGCAHLFGGEAPLLADLETRLAAQGFKASAAIADTAGAAWAIAWYGTGYKTRRIVPADEHPAALEHLPVSALRLPQQTAAELIKLGLVNIGSIAELPRAPLAARFGAHLLRQLDHALGREDEVLSPMQPVAELVSEKRFADPIVHEEDIRQMLARLIGNIVPLLERRGLGMRQCTLRLFRVDGDVVSLSVQSGNALRAADRMAALFYERLAALHDGSEAGWDAGFGFDLMRLSVEATEPLAASQHDMISSSGTQDGIGYLLDRLSARLGAAKIQVIKANDSHIPERRAAFSPAIHSAPARFGLHESALAVAEADTVRPVTRPLLLLTRPELIDVIAEVPDGPPSRFRWRKVPYSVNRCEGPERIACEWWKDGRGYHTRDYYRIEDEAGYRFWLFRHGLYVRETSAPKWFMHGLFA
ncbi:Y-family DNA polymerase [Salaquimonas pukyongi]|uniref:Y-family DNA polymerase n=1 Tax=Salaquimonas pukyongi TaxID=2712698 RepID=UPI00096BA96D|nr:DNA polymerase Y family protein [Salaquimonas pukyongi]